MENYSLSDIAAASGGEGLGGANSWVLIILFALIFGGGGFGFGGNQAALLGLISEHMEELKALYPKSYNAIINRVRSL